MILGVLSLSPPAKAGIFAFLMLGVRLEDRTMDFPKLRTDVSVFPVTVDGRNMIFVQDSQRLSEGVFIPHEVFARLVSFFDGSHSIRDIQYETMRRYGELLYKERIEAVIEELDRALLLETPRFTETLSQFKEDFSKDKLRRAFFSGKSYAEGAAPLRDQLEAYFSGPGGPGKPDLAEKTEGLRGIMAPHIDFQRGGGCYAWAYRLLGEARRADLYIVLGIAHTPSAARFAVTAKDFETPLGVLETDKDFVNGLAERCSWNIFQDEFLHRSEHSIEFQVVFLQYLFGSKGSTRIVPILCGSFDDYFDQQRHPEDDALVSEFLDALRSMTAASGKRVCFIAGVDLSHMGPQFGDSEHAGTLVRSEIKRDDLEVLNKVAALDADGFYREVARHKNKHRICGLPAIYALLRTIDASHGEILRYDQGPTPDGRSIVSFAAMVFYESSGAKTSRPQER
jgi:hypothetical protein